MSNSQFRSFGAQGFRGQSNTRGFGAEQPAPTQQGFQGNGYNQRDDEPVVAWLNIMVSGKGSEKKKLGKGIPLRDSNQLERAILNLFFDADGNQLDFNPEALMKAISLDVRPAGQPDAEFEIDLFGSMADEAPNKSTQRQARNAPPKAEEEEPANAEDLEPEQPATRPQRRTLKAK